MIRIVSAVYLKGAQGLLGSEPQRRRWEMRRHTGSHDAFRAPWSWASIIASLAALALFLMVFWLLRPAIP
jgi:hypothetical protein